MAERITINSWTQFKSLCIESKHLLIQYLENDDSYDIYAPESNIIMWQTTITKGTDDAVDFETNYKSKANLPLESRSYDNIQRIAATLYQVEDSFYIKGDKINIAPLSTGKIEFQFPYDIKMIGIVTQWKNSDVGDFIECSVGFYSGEDWIELSKYGETLYVVNSNSMDISTNDYAVIPAGLIVRIEYTNVSETNAKDFICWLKSYR
jgi:hypothetical protein